MKEEERKEGEGRRKGHDSCSKTDRPRPLKGFISPTVSEGNRQILLLCFMGKVKGFVSFLAVKEY